MEGRVRRLARVVLLALRLLELEHLTILKSPEIIALNQDPLGIAGDLVWKQGSKEVSPPAAALPQLVI